MRSPPFVGTLALVPEGAAHHGGRQMHQMSGGTLTLTEPLLSWDVAVKIAVPSVTNVATPASDTVATLGSEHRQATPLVRI